MPKKRTRTFIAKPAHTAHHTLVSTGARESDRFHPTASASDASVNDLISHLRRTQVSTSAHESQPSSSPHTLALARSVPPSLRTVLDLPEAQTPRSRPNAPPRIVPGTRRRRPTPGPAPPESWLSEGARGSVLPEGFDLSSADARKIIFRLQRLPDVRSTGFPGEQTFKHAILKDMASNFSWHVDYDGLFLTQLPWHIRALLLSYIACFGGEEKLDRRMMGLKLLFPTQTEYAEITREQPGLASEIYSDPASLITRLDLGGAMGNWLSFRQLTQELFVTTERTDTATSPNLTQENIPDSWDQYDEAVSKDPHRWAASGIPQSLDEGLRFNKLRLLSLAHPNPSSVSWDSLLRLLSRLSTITHLSLAHWPAPFRGSARHRPAKFKLSEETSAILRQLSRFTYCLKWLDVEGCSDWISALTWEGHSSHSYPGRQGSTGPEWNGAWRDIQWVNLAPGWNLVDQASWNGRPLDLPINTKTSISAPDFKIDPLAVPAYSTPKDFGAGRYLNLDAEDEELLFLRQRAFIRYHKTVESWYNQTCEARSTYAEIRQIRGPRGKRIAALTGAEGLEMENISRFLADTTPLVEKFLGQHLDQTRVD